MRAFLVAFLLAGGAAMMAVPAPAAAQLSAGVVLDRDGLRHVHLAVGQVFGVPVQTVSRYHPGWIGHDELPVVYLVAREAGVSPAVVLALREAGWSWIQITDHLRIDPYLFVRHLPTYGPPYGVAHGYWRKPGRRHLHRLSDRLIIDYVNVYFWSVAHRRPVTEVIIVRERYPTWIHYVHVEAPRVRFQEPPRTRTVWWNEPASAAPPVAPRPAQPRGTAPVNVPAAGNRAAPQPGSAARVENAPAAARGQAPAPAPSAARGPATGPAPQATARGPASVPAPSSARGQASHPAPAASRSTATPLPPSAGRGQAPAPSPAAARPAASRPGGTTSPAPAASRPTAGAPAARPAAAPRPASAPTRAAPPPASARGQGAARTPPAGRGSGGG